MAKSKIDITFLKTLSELDFFVINISTPQGNFPLRERFVNNLPSPRPSGYVLITTDLQASRYYDALVADYSAQPYVTFSRNGNTVTIEAVNECSINIECVEYTIATYSQTGVSFSYTDCDGIVGGGGIGGASGYDAETFCAKKGSVNYSGQAQLAQTGTCGSGAIYGPTLFTVLQAPSDVTSYSILISNNDCSGVNPPTDTEGHVFSEAMTNPCDNINICVTTSELLVKIGKIQEQDTIWDIGYVNNRTDTFNETGQWRTIPMAITQDGGCPNLYSVIGTDYMIWTIGSFDPNKLTPQPFQYFLQNNSAQRTITLKTKFDVTVRTSYNSVYTLYIIHRDLNNVTKEFRQIGGLTSINPNVYDYSIDYEGDFNLEVGDKLCVVQHILGSIAGNRIVSYVEYSNFEFSVTCVVDNTTSNASNPYCIDVPRGVDYTLEGYDANDQFYTQTFSVPNPLAIDDISIIWENTPTESYLTIEHNTGLTLMYNIDGGAWQTLNEFVLVPGTSYTLNIKDEYGCELAIPFTIDEEVYNEPKLVSRYACNSLHELNVGKYLNLCGKQWTMKIGFVCNDQPNAIKIFKHIQMILNVNYAIKNVVVKTSMDQERFVPGTHMVYRIRESMHSVPLKNPYDYDDLRGSWAYIELEIESIDNQKVDLFSVITHLRKSTI